MAQTTTTQIDPGVNVYYNKTLLAYLEPNMIHGRYGTMYRIPSKSSTTAKWRRYNLLTPATTPLTEGTTPASSQLSKTDITVTLNQYGQFVELTDKVQLVVEDPILNETSKLLAQSMSQSIDTLIRDVIVAGTTVQYQGGANRAGVSAVLDAAGVRKVVRTLKNNNVLKITEQVDPTDKFNSSAIPAAYIGLVHPNTVYGWRDPDFKGFTPVEKYSNRVALPNEVGSIDEVRFIESTNTKVFTGAGAAAADVYATVIFGKDFYGVTEISELVSENIIKPLGSAGAADPLNQRSTSGWKTMFATVRLQELAGVRVEHTVVA
ncbi:MAG: N4-gp56 family major capsid protein [Paraclostridium sp.]